ncbi:unnamed protein product [Rangifer tarandus platyrhynchus]|uniref:Uncharacterized protein n=1 Tax=Rangifer tarandus platyrhynchus TaxID=3082113 RepID=A0AC59YSA9_RANTA
MTCPSLALQSPSRGTFWCWQAGFTSVSGSPPAWGLWAQCHLRLTCSASRTQVPRVGGVRLRCRNLRVLPLQWVRKESKRVKFDLPEEEAPSYCPKLANQGIAAYTCYLELWRQVLEEMGFPGVSAGKESAYNVGDLGSIPGLGKSHGEGKGYLLQYSGLENSMNCIVQWGHKESDTTERLSLH